MLKRGLILLMSLCMVIGVAGCKKNPGNLSVESGADSSLSIIEEPEEFALNPLTGIKDLDIGKEKNRPVAVMVNNISVAQPVQTGIGKADIVYETAVEGGITRLMAVYQDISKVKKIGTVRSARYAYIDLAMGHNALYVHHGQDRYHAMSHLNDVGHFVVGSGQGGGRESNGLSTEHTLYAYGKELWSKIKASGLETKNKSTDNWVKFADEDTEIELEAPATDISVTFSGSYKTGFKYDSESKKYIRYSNGVLRKDYVTGESESFKNIFVLKTSIYKYPNCTDGKNHKYVDLSSGKGYYIVNGTSTEIKWSKGSSSNPLKFTDLEGNEITVNPGNTWVCLPNGSNSIVIE